MVLLPAGYFEETEPTALRSLVFRSVFDQHSGVNTLIGEYQKDTENQESFCSSVPVLLDPVEYGPIEDAALTLGQLDAIFKKRSSDLLEPLRGALYASVGDDGVKSNSQAVTLLLLGIPRTLDGQKIGLEVQGFVATIDFCELGERLGLLHRIPGEKTYYKSYPPTDPIDIWKEIPIDAVNAQAYPGKREVRLYSGLPPDDNGPTGIIAGVGALGGASC